MSTGMVPFYELRDGQLSTAAHAWLDRPHDGPHVVRPSALGGVVVGVVLVVFGVGAGFGALEKKAPLLVTMAFFSVGALFAALTIRWIFMLLKAKHGVFTIVEGGLLIDVGAGKVRILALAATTGIDVLHNLKNGVHQNTDITVHYRGGKHVVFVANKKAAEVFANIISDERNTVIQQLANGPLPEHPVRRLFPTANAKRRAAGDKDTATVAGGL